MLRLSRAVGRLRPYVAVSRLATTRTARMSTSRNKERSFVTVINPTSSFNSFLHPEPKETKEEGPIVLEAPKHLDIALTPEQIVSELDKHIIGQADAKRAVSLALRNRWRRKMLPAELRQEVHPMNILMAGPTGSGKTEIARRLAKLAQAPFVKVEATRYTEVGYVGADTSSMIKDLADAAFTMIMDQKRLLVKDQARRAAEDIIIAAILEKRGDDGDKSTDGREALRRSLQKGSLDDQDVEVSINPPKPSSNNPLASILGDGNVSGSSSMENVLELFTKGNGKKKPTRVRTKVKEAMTRLLTQEEEKLIDRRQVQVEAARATEESGIVFLDEIDKLAFGTNDNVSVRAFKGEGVQKELLTLIEGTTVNTSYGPIKTDHILFIAAGAFHRSKPSDLMPELQGRLPIRVQLAGLTEHDLLRILTETKYNLIQQQTELMRTEGVKLEFTQDSIDEIARFAAHLNLSVENIGARRLHTIISRVLADISFHAPSKVKALPAGEKQLTETVTADYVKDKVKSLSQQTDLHRYIL